MRMRTLAAVAALPLALCTVPANAAPQDTDDVAQVVGTGTITPGLLPVCQPQSVKFTATAAVDAGAHTGSYAVSFVGSGSCDSLAAGAGTGTLSGGVSGTVNYTRTGGYVSLSGTVSLNGDTAVIERGDCNFAPTSANPVTSFALHCQVALSTV